MPVNKFGHTDSSSVQRVVAGGVTLTQINNSFVRLDGSNAFVPSEDNHITTKKYVDDRDATKVSKAGDTVSGDFFISASSEPAGGLRVLINDEPAIEIVKNALDTVGRINVNKDIYMYGGRITGLADPVGDGGAATKKYVDESCKKSVSSDIFLIWKRTIA